MKRYLFPLVMILVLVTVMSCSVGPAPVPILQVQTDADGRFVIQQAAGAGARNAMTIEGVVTENFGGPVVANAQVSYPANIFTVPGDIIITKDGYSIGKIQGVIASAVQGYTYHLPLRALFNPNWTRVPPLLTVEGVRPGDVVTGTIDLDIQIGTQFETYAIYVWVGGEQRGQRVGAFFDVDEAQLSINTAAYPSGTTYLRFMIYDRNHNTTLHYMPIVFDNPVVHETLPGATQIVQLTATTLGTKFGYYSEPRSNPTAKSPVSVPRTIEVHELETQILSQDILQERIFTADITVTCALAWAGVANATGYKVYRSFDGEDYHLVGMTTTANFNDHGYDLAPNKQTFYKIIPFNSLGDSEADPIIRYVWPLPGFAVYLDSPAHNEADVDLEPTFEWDLEYLGGTAADFASAWMDYSIHLFDATWWRILDEDIEDDLFYEMPFELEPGGIYSWDIYYAQALKFSQYFSTQNWARAFSYAGQPDAYWSNGSANGEFMFTTTTDAGN